MKTRLALKIICAFALLLPLQSCSEKPKPNAKENAAPSVRKPDTKKSITKDIIYAKSQAELDKATAQGNIVVDIHGEAWCAPCKQMAPVIKALADEMPAVTFVKVNVDDFKPKAGFRGVPTFVFYKDGKEIYRFTGAKSKAVFKTMVEQKFGL